MFRYEDTKISLLELSGFLVYN